jgi:hypothetical protein
MVGIRWLIWLIFLRGRFFYALILRLLMAGAIIHHTAKMDILIDREEGTINLVIFLV